MKNIGKSIKEIVITIEKFEKWGLYIDFKIIC